MAILRNRNVFDIKGGLFNLVITLYLSASLCCTLSFSLSLPLSVTLSLSLSFQPLPYLFIHFYFPLFFSVYFPLQAFSFLVTSHLVSSPSFSLSLSL